MFIKIQDITGESVDDDHKDWIDVLSWSWGATQVATSHAGGGSGKGHASVQDFSFTKWSDTSSPAFAFSCLAGKHIPKAELQCTKAGGGDTPLVYLRIILSGVFVTSFQAGGAGTEDRLIDQISLNFAKIEYHFTTQTAKGGQGAKPNMSWDIKAGNGSIS